MKIDSKFSPEICKGTIMSVIETKFTENVEKEWLV